MPINTLKICSQCGIIKDFSEFFRNKSSSDGFHSKCKECKKHNELKNINKKREKEREWRLQNKERIIENGKTYYKKNKLKINQNNKIYREKNPECMINYRKKNKDKIRIQARNYYDENKTYRLKQNSKYKKNRMKNDITYRLLNTIRSRIRSAIKNNYGIKSIKSISLLGCSIEYAKKHIESQFQKGMSWDNYSLRGWHIDHIKPCAEFDLTKEEEQRKCFHYINLQPLWAKDNLIKGSK